MSSCSRHLWRRTSSARLSSLQVGGLKFYCLLCCGLLTSHPNSCAIRFLLLLHPGLRFVVYGLWFVVCMLPSTTLCSNSTPHPPPLTPPSSSSPSSSFPAPFPSSFSSPVSSPQLSLHWAPPCAVSPCFTPSYSLYLSSSQYGHHP